MLLSERKVIGMPYQYIPQQNPYYTQMFQAPQMPNMMQAPQMAQTQPAAQPAGLTGRMVTSREEALGVPVDFSGQPMVFPDLAHGAIYVKVFNAGTGASDFREYRLQAGDTDQPTGETMKADANWAKAEDLEKLREETKQIREDIAAMKKQRRKVVEELE